MEYAWKNISAWKNVNAWNNPTEVNRSPSVVQFLHEVNVFDRV